MVTKCVILANGPRLLREMLQHVINKTDGLKVVREIAGYEELPSAIERFNPDWVILSCNNGGQNWLDPCLAEYASVRFILFLPGERKIKMKWQASYEEDLTNLSLKDFIHVLERDLQHI